MISSRRHIFAVLLLESFLPVVIACAFFESHEVYAQGDFGTRLEKNPHLSVPVDSIEDMVRRLEETENRLNLLESEKRLDHSKHEPFVTQDASLELKKEASPLDDLKGSTEVKESAKTKSSMENAKVKEKAWYDKLKIRGYTQLRFNDVIDLENGSAPAQNINDSSVGENQEFLIRRARLILQGDVSDHLSVYLQPDFASNVPGSTDANQFVQIRDWYGDVHLDTTKIHRIRLGQSKIPYGWENLQSSSNRLPLDRADATNSASRNERDLGIFYYWTPQYAQKFYQTVLDEGLKGSGNYGVLGVGFYNGQGGSFREQNDNLHFVTRYSLPVTLDCGQRMELGIQGYRGYYTVLSSPISPLGLGAPVRPLGTLETGNEGGILDERLGTTFVFYPEPLGFQAEWNVGRGPSLNDTQTAVVERDLHGGYVMTMYRIKTCLYGECFPFYRFQYFQGGYKSERNAPFNYIQEHELGLEWQIDKHLELVGMYTVTDRTNTRAASTADTLSYNQFDGQIARFQFQFNF